MMYDLECLYCGKLWEQQIWNPEMTKIECMSCKEAKLIKVRKRDDRSRDVFGYRFSPEFPPKKEPATNWNDTYEHNYLRNSD